MSCTALNHRIWAVGELRPTMRMEGRVLPNSISNREASVPFPNPSNGKVSLSLLSLYSCMDFKVVFKYR